MPEKLSGHKILKAIGSGGMGCVYLAVDEALGRKVAIKTLNRRYAGNPTLQERFMREARAMAKLSHPNIVRIYSLGPANEPPHFVMEYLEGASLVDAARALPFRQKAALMLKVARAVGFLHANQTIHRDLKPGNILVGSDLEPKVLDFGLALQADDSGRRLTIPGEIMGTPDYFSPEHVRGVAFDAASDVFSLGTIFTKCSAGTLPFPVKDVGEQMAQIRERDPVLPRRLNESIPGELQNICLKALEKNPKSVTVRRVKWPTTWNAIWPGSPSWPIRLPTGECWPGKIEQHLRELEGWKRDHILTEYEYDGFRKNYGRLIEREDAWIMQARRLSLPQVSLYLGAWTIDCRSGAFGAVPVRGFARNARGVGGSAGDCARGVFRRPLVEAGALPHCCRVPAGILFAAACGAGDRDGRIRLVYRADPGPGEAGANRQGRLLASTPPICSFGGRSRFRCRPCTGCVTSQNRPSSR